MIRKARFGEILILVTGVLLIGNVWYIAHAGDFTYWLVAKIVYFTGVILFILDR